MLASRIIHQPKTYHWCAYKNWLAKHSNACKIKRIANYVFVGNYSMLVLRLTKMPLLLNSFLVFNSEFDA